MYNKLASKCVQEGGGAKCTGQLGPLTPDVFEQTEQVSGGKGSLCHLKSRGLLALGVCKSAHLLIIFHHHYAFKRIARRADIAYVNIYVFVFKRIDKHHSNYQ